MRSGEKNLRSNSEVERKEGNFSSGIPEYICQDCKKSFFGWAKPDICPECGGKLKLAK